MGDVNKTQELLEGLSPKPLPPELREKILSTAYQRQRKFLVISPVLRMLFAISCVLAVLAFFCDIMIRNSENNFLGSIMNGSQVSEMILDKDLQEMTKELFKIEYDQPLNQWLARHYTVKKKEAKLTSYQSIMDILKE